MSFQIIVIDDHPIVSEGICQLLNQVEGVRCSALSSLENIQTELVNLQTDLFILDLSLPEVNGFHLIDAIHQSCPQTQILIYTMHEESWIVEQLARSHVQGAVSKSDSLQELVQAVQCIRSGGRYFSTTFSLLREGVHTDGENCTETPVLSSREKEVLNYIAQGKNTTEIADLLFLSVNTIHTYRKRLMAKLEARNVAELVYKGKDLF